MNNTEHQPLGDHTAEPRARLQRERLIARIVAEYHEMAGLSLTQAQARKLFDVAPDAFPRILDELVKRGLVKLTPEGLLVRY